MPSNAETTCGDCAKYLTPKCPRCEYKDRERNRVANASTDSICDEFDVATATTVEEAKELAATGFDYFTTMNSVQIFRKPKMFQKYRY